MSALLPCVEIEAETTPASAAVIWMHGLGADGHDFEPIVPLLRMPWARFVFPHAPSMPITINAGFVMPAWYDILSLEHVGGRENEGHVRASAERIVALVERERTRGIAPERIVLAGFSQGAAMALHVGVRYPERLGGIVVLSGYHLLPETFESERSEAQRSTPMLFCHGLYDPLVPIVLGEKAHATVQRWSTASVDWHSFPIEHQVSIEEIETVGAWLRAHLPESDPGEA